MSATQKGRLPASQDDGKCGVCCRPRKLTHIWIAFCRQISQGAPHRDGQLKGPLRKAGRTPPQPASKCWAGPRPAGRGGTPRRRWRFSRPPAPSCGPKWRRPGIRPARPAATALRGRGGGVGWHSTQEQVGGLIWFRRFMAVALCQQTWKNEANPELPCALEETRLRWYGAKQPQELKQTPTHRR